MIGYQLTRAAQTDIEDIIDYICVTLQNPDGADVVLEYLYGAMQEVTEEPSRGHRRPDLMNRPVKFYRSSKKHKYYLIFDSETEPVTILRVASIRRDFLSLLE